jgi:hypothetical protein
LQHYLRRGAFDDVRFQREYLLKIGVRILPGFHPQCLGKDMEGWPGDQWLDIRRLDRLAPIMEARLELAAQKGCAGVDPANVDGETHDTGFPRT